MIGNTLFGFNGGGGGGGTAGTSGQTYGTSGTSGSSGSAGTSGQTYGTSGTSGSSGSSIAYRILKPEGKMRLIHPYYKSVRAIQDPTHKFPPIAENSYFYWDKKWREDNKLDHYPINCDFSFSIYYTFQDATVANKNEETRLFSIDKYWNIVADLMVDLVKK
jgi:hypothetical protein